MSETWAGFPEQHVEASGHSTQAVISLMEMGFDEKEVLDALRVNNNQQSAAVSTVGGGVGETSEPQPSPTPPPAPSWQAS